MSISLEELRCPHLTSKALHFSLSGTEVKVQDLNKLVQFQIKSVSSNFFLLFFIKSRSCKETVDSAHI